MLQTCRRSPALLLLLVFSIASSVQAQRDDSRSDFYERGPFRQTVQRPQRVLRFDIGETNEHRMMHLVAVSAPENTVRLEQIRDNIARLSDPRNVSAQEAEQLMCEMPVIVWLNYMIYGKESASFEAMMQVAYQLAASLPKTRTFAASGTPRRGSSSTLFSFHQHYKTKGTKHV